jgi:hypothetical protein
MQRIRECVNDPVVVNPFDEYGVDPEILSKKEVT